MTARLSLTGFLILALGSSVALAKDGAGKHAGGGKNSGTTERQHKSGNGNADTTGGTADGTGKHKKDSATTDTTTTADSAKQDRTAKVGDVVDKREARQAKRIHEGIQKGYLTPDEQAKLKTEQDSLASMESSFKSDGAISKTEAKQLRDALDTASIDIWAEKHDTEGNQKPMMRLGKDIFAKDSITGQIEGGISATQARAITHDFRTMVSLKQALATSNATDADRAKMQAQYDELLNKYFEVRG